MCLMFSLDDRAQIAQVQKPSVESSFCLPRRGTRTRYGTLPMPIDDQRQALCEERGAGLARWNRHALTAHHDPSGRADAWKMGGGSGSLRLGITSLFSR